VLSQQEPRRTDTPTKQGFDIPGREGTFAGLAAAVNAAQDGDVIDVHGDGPFLTPPLTIQGKRLTIRAALGSQPVFVMERPGIGSRQPFIRSDSSLRLEGLEVQWSMEFTPGRSEVDMLGRSIIAATDGRLTVAYCRFVSNRINFCGGGSCRDLIAYRCPFVAKRGCGIMWRREPGGQTDVEGCIFETRTSVTLSIAMGLDGSLTKTRISHNVTSGERGFQLLMERPPRQPIPLSADHNV